MDFSNRNGGRAEIEQQRIRARNRHADRHGIGSEARLARAVRRDADASGHVHEMQRDLSRLRGKARPVGEAAEVPAAAQADHRGAGTARERDAVLYGVAPHGLAEPEAAVEHRKRRQVELQLGAAIGDDLAFPERLEVLRKPHRAVRVVAGEARVYQGVRDQRRLARVAAGPYQQRFASVRNASAAISSYLRFLW